MTLHQHSEHSFLDGRARTREIAEAALAAGHNHIAITDHDEVGGHLDFQKSCTQVGVKPILGTEARWVHSVAASREAKTAGRDSSHIILLAGDQTGLRNLWSLSSLAYEPEYFYMKPQLEPALLREHADGLWASDGCGLTRFANLVTDGDEDAARREWAVLLDIFGDRFYSELHTFQIIDPVTDEDKALNAKITAMNQAKVRFAKEMGVPLVVVNDAHYALQHQWEEHRLVYNLSTQAYRKDQVEAKGQAADWLMNPTEMVYWLGRHGIPTSVAEEAIRTTRWIADQCNAEIKPTLAMPRLYPTDAEDAAAFRRNIEDGFKRFVLDKGLPENLYRERLEYEARLIVDKGMAGYFNIVGDYVMAARNGSYRQWLDPRATPDPCLCGPGRGSGGGSLVNYVLGITSLDPIKFDLMFERFINPDRPDYPDIDVDFQKSKRAGVKEYLGARYGEANVCSIGTRARSGPKQMLKDLCRAMKIDFTDTLKMVDLIGEVDNIEVDEDGLDEHQQPPTWDEVLSELEGDLAPWARKYPLLFQRLEQMVGLVRQAGVHAAGVVVNTEPLLGNLPTRVKKGVRATQFDMHEVAEMGGVKDDLLANKGLDTLAIARTLIYDRHKVWLDYDGFGFGVPDDAQVITFGDEQYNDPAIWTQIDRGQTAGIFQIGTPGGTKQAMRFKPRSLVELADLASINRPGVIRAGQLEHYLKRRNGDEDVTYDHPLMEPITGPSSSMYTYGILVYQEQLIRTARDVAGFTAGQAEELRKAIGKKLADKIAEIKPRFIDGCLANEEFTGQGGGRATALKIWASLEAAGAYAFNKCISGDVLVKLSASSQHTSGTMSVEDMWRRLHGEDRPTGATCRFCLNRPHLKGKGYCGACKSWRDKFRYKGLKAWSLGDDGRLHPNRIIDVHRNGVQPVWRVTLEDGKSITATANHRHMTDRGWREVSDLAVGDRLLVCGEYEAQQWEPEEYRLTSGDRTFVGNRLPNHLRTGTNSVGYVDGGYLALQEWTSTQDWVCSEPGCDRSRTAGHRIERAHLDGDRTNNAPTNLAMKCASHHKVFDYQVNGRRKRGEKGYPAIAVRVVSVEYVGDQMTYDLEMADPFHSWVGNDIVTHNSHATGYAMQPCWEIWTKHYFFDEFITACLTVMPEKTTAFIRECRKRDRPILPPDINKSGARFTLTDDGIRYGLTDIRGIGESVVPDIVAHRPYTSITDYLDRVSPNKGGKKGVVDNLIKVGAFDAICDTDRQQMLDEVYYARAGAEVSVNKWAKLTVDERDQIVSEKWAKKPDDYPVFDFADEKFLIAMETELLGTHVSVDPMARYAAMIEGECVNHPTDIDDYETGARFTIGGELTKVKRHKQRNGKEMAFLSVRWAEEDFEIVAFADAWEANQRMLQATGVPVACEVIKLSKGCQLSVVERLDWF